MNSIDDTYHFLLYSNKDERFRYLFLIILIWLHFDYIHFSG